MGSIGPNKLTPLPTQADDRSGTAMSKTRRLYLACRSSSIDDAANTTTADRKRRQVCGGCFGPSTGRPWFPFYLGDSTPSYACRDRDMNPQLI